MHFFLNGRTQHIISVVYEDQSTSDLFDERMNLFVNHKVIILHILIFLCDCFFSISAGDFMWFYRFFA